VIKSVISVTILINYCLLTGGAHARILSTDRTAARGAVVTWRIRRQTRVVPIAMSALVPGRALAQIVGAPVDVRTRSVIAAWRRGAVVLQFAVGTRAPWRADTPVHGTI